MTGNDKDSRNPGVIPLRTILTNFLNIVESAEAGDPDNPDQLDVYDKEFQELKDISEELKTDQFFQCKEGEKSVNRKKNRYKDILPFDYTRVILNETEDVAGSDYINANFIKGASGSSAYIACQGPLPHTVNDFWRMVVECEVQVIVMACNEQESGKHKCENYWVEEDNVERQFGEVTVWLRKCRNVCADFLVRTMRIRYTSPSGELEERNVCQFHYGAWPDHGVPAKVRPLLDMVRLIRECQTSETLPVLVHCSAGCGRTGTICAIDYVWGLLRLGKLNADFSLFQLVREMRRQRIAMVQTKDQYVLVHRAVKELFQEQLKIIDAHPYENVDVFGLPLDLSEGTSEPHYETVEFDTKYSAKKTSLTKHLSIPSIVFDGDVNNPGASNNDKDSKENRRRNSSNLNNDDTLDDITVLSSDCDNAEKEKPVKTRSSILRKPSIVKLKAFFEKSKDKEVKGTSQGLSRAKSDVSSRFHAFNKVREARRVSPIEVQLPESENSVPLSTKKESSRTSKPPLFAKPSISIKRSKSLKVGKEEDSAEVSSKFPMLLKDKILHLRKSKSKHSDQHPLYSSTQNVSNLHQSYESPPKENASLNKDNSNQSNSIATKEDGSTSPLTPNTKISKIRMGMAREMEDVFSLSRSNNGVKTIQKYDTVTPSNIFGRKTSLTRSHSQVWTPPSYIPPTRIFSDDNINQCKTTRAEVNTNIQVKVADTATFNDTMKSNYSDSAIQPYPARRRLPKTNPYANYTPPNLHKTGTSQPHRTQESVSSQSTIDSTYSSTSNSSNPKKCTKELPLPNLTSAGNRSRENSSESSVASSPMSVSASNSNPGTPRSTPTQTLEHTTKSNVPTCLNGRVSSKQPRSQVSCLVQKKTILKGSLSSSPSESEEKIDYAHQIAPTPIHSQHSVNITAPQKVSAVRIAIRERRNSFRQAVWKEHDQEDTDTIQSPESYGNYADLKSSYKCGRDDEHNTPGRSYSTDHQRLSNYGSPFSNSHVNSDRNDSNVTGRSSAPLDPVSRQSVKPPSGLMSRRDKELCQPATALSKPSDIIGDRVSYSVDRSCPPPYQVPGQYTNVVSHQSSRKDKDYEPIWPDPGPHRMHPPKGQVDKALCNGNAPESALHRIDDIRVLLDELSSSPSPQQRSAEDVPDAPPHVPKSTSSSVTLKHQRSLRNPSRPTNPSLSCFTFRKLSSLESLNDSSHYRLPLMYSDKLQSSDNSSPNSSSSYHPSNNFRTAPSLVPSVDSTSHSKNDYADLAPRSASANPAQNPHCEYIPPPLNGRKYNEGFNTPSTIPVAPPRTKRSQQKLQYTNGDHHAKGNGNETWKLTNGHNEIKQTFSLRGDSGHKPSTSSAFAGANNNGTSANNKYAASAFGRIQAKAANVRSRLANWGDKAINNRQVTRSTSSSSSVECPIEDGFGRPGSDEQMRVQPPRFKSKHQYL